MRGEEDEAAQRTRVGGGEWEEVWVVYVRGSEEWVEPGEIGDGEVVLDGHDWKQMQAVTPRYVLLPTMKSKQSAGGRARCAGDGDGWLLRQDRGKSVSKTIP